MTAGADTALIEEVFVTPANVNDGKASPEALPDDPGDTFADSAYRGRSFSDAVKAKGRCARVVAIDMRGSDEKETKKRLRDRNRPIQQVRARIEKIFGTAKRIHGLRRMRWRGLAKAALQVRLTAIAYNLKRTLNKGCSRRLTGFPSVARSEAYTNQKSLINQSAAPTRAQGALCSACQFCSVKEHIEMQTSPRLGLSYIQPQQAQKHVTANESFRRLDALAQLSVKSRTLASQPPNQLEGDCCLLPAAPTGAAWTSQPQGTIVAFQDGDWTAIAPRKGWRAFVEDAGAVVVHNGSAWINEAALGAEGAFSRLTVRKAGLLNNSFVSDGNYQTLALSTYSSSAGRHAPYLQSLQARGAESAPAAVANGDAVFNFDMFGHDGSAFVRLGQFGFGVGGEVSAGVVPGTLSFKIADNAGVLNTVMLFTAGGDCGVGVSSPTIRLHVDGAVRVKSYTKDELSSAAGQSAGAIVYVSDEAGGAVLAFSDGTTCWRATDRAVVS